MHYKKGFSLIELMIVVAILGILVAVALPHFIAMTENAKQTKAKEHIAVIIGALIRFNNMEKNDATSIDMLIGKYLVKIPVDPWNNKYQIDSNLGIVYSFGPDGKDEGMDDIIVSYLPRIMLMSANYLDDRELNPDFVGQSDEIVIMFSRPIDDIEPPSADPNDDFVFFSQFFLTYESGMEIAIKQHDGSTLTGEPSFGTDAYYRLDSKNLKSVTIVLGIDPVIIPNRTYLNLNKNCDRFWDMMDTPVRAKISDTLIPLKE